MPSSVSVVLATHNGERFLEEQLGSILDQSLLPYELVITDDASTDRTREIVRSFAARSPVPVVCIWNQPGLGFRENFLNACNKATGEWIAFCDQDDVWMPDKLEACSSFFSLPTVLMIAHQASLIGESGAPLGLFRQGITRTRIRQPLAYDPWNTFYGFSQIFRRSILKCVQSEGRFVDFIDPRHQIAHDRWVGFLAQTLGSTAEVARPLVRYRQHSHNLFGARSLRRCAARSVLEARNGPYVQAAEEMLALIVSLPSWCEEQFVQFDRAQAIRFYERIHRAAAHREAVYQQGGMKGMKIVASGVRGGVYSSVPSGGVRWRAVFRDLTSCMWPT
jgi:glycosyltransferase involved in cell wall biosynthesis